MRSIVIELVAIAGIAFLLGGMCSTIISAANQSHDARGYTVCKRHG